MLRHCVKIPFLLNYNLVRTTTAPLSSIQYTRNVSHHNQNFTCTSIYSQRQYSEKCSTESMIVDFEKVKNSISKKEVYIIDVREPEEIKEHGKIPNSVNIPLGTVSSILSNMSDKEFEKTYNRPKPSEDSEIIFYCMIGKRSGMAQQNAINLGFRNVKNYLGSWTDWANQSH